MSDRRRIVSIDAAGTVTTVKDLEDATNYLAVRDTFTFKAADRQQINAASSRRYGGARTVAETHGNASYTWQALVKGTTADLCLQNIEDALGLLEMSRSGYFFEWRPDGATNSTFREIRGPATYTPTYRWAQFQGVQSMVVEVTVPVEPLGRGAASAITIASTTMPNVIALGTAIGGDAPALADLSLRTNGGTSPPIWAMIGWTKRPASPLAGSVAPFGIIEGESGTLTGWASTADATYRGGTGAKITASGVGSASGLYAVDPSVMQADDFANGELDIEVWARMDIASALISPKVTLSLQPFGGLSFGAEQFAADTNGSTGKLLVKPASGSAFRLVRLGTLRMPIDTAAPLKWNVKVAASWGAGSTGVFGLDYLVMVPSRQRALSATGKPNDAAYPDFIVSTADTTKTIRTDLSGRVAAAAGSAGVDAGLGGSPLELPPGNVDVLVVLSSVVPDDPTIDTASMQLSHTAVTGSVRVTPRYWVARGT